MVERMKHAWSGQRDAATVAAELGNQLAAADPVAIVLFASHQHDGAAISGLLGSRFPGCEVIGCTTAGEFTAARPGVQSVAAVAFGKGLINAAAAALAKHGDAVHEGVWAATSRMGKKLGVDLRKADPSRYVGVLLAEGLRGKEEAVNAALGDVAPLLSFVGGSAGDNLEFKSTRVFVNGEESDDGTALLLLDAAVPFTVIKTCSFEPCGQRFTVTRADEKNRVVYELDGLPVAEVYAKAAGVAPSALDGGVFMSRPVGLMIDGKPWIRSPQRLLDDGGLKFYCRIDRGAEIELMRSTDLIADTRDALRAARAELGGTMSGGVAFNCILRRLELDANHQHGNFVELFSGMQLAGFHTYGESWLGHINQTLTALLFS